jgi:hypothetical protein
LNAPERLGPACLARAIAVDNAAFRQVIWRKFDVYAVAGKNLDVVPAQTAGDVRENDVTVVKFDGKRRAWKHLFNASEHLERGFSVVLGGLRFGSSRIRIAIASCDNGYSFPSL